MADQDLTQEELVGKYVGLYGECYRPSIEGAVAFYFENKERWEEWAKLDDDGGPFKVDRYIEQIVAKVRF